MHAFSRKLLRYSAFLYTTNGETEARINLYCEDARLYLIFRDFTARDVAKYNPTSHTGVAYQNFEAYPAYIDMVRNEDPVWVTFRIDQDPPTFAVICAAEPPGESED
jgi:hypothetical protein